MRISDWSSDVCSSDLHRAEQIIAEILAPFGAEQSLSAAVREGALERCEHEAGDEQVDDEEIEPEENAPVARFGGLDIGADEQDRQSTRLNSSHSCDASMPSSA